ncbi:MAG: flagellar basal body L-ring protein FlgH [Gammaproteobacteria bacterium]|nr:flagellar basal body L-ring protein FlgH [Gammaproteobacteria bacterium]
MRISTLTMALIGALLTAPAGADSLFDATQFRPLSGDQRALRVGDNLTVIVTEFASLTTSARTATDKQADLGVNITGSTSGTKFGTGNVSEDFSGGGKIERSGKLVAQLTVVVQSVEANGDLRVKGEQEIEFNEEKQMLYVEGRVRPQDIQSNNSVLSTRLSDAKIRYTGDGLLAEKQSPGILTRFLGWLHIL